MGFKFKISWLVFIILLTGCSNRESGIDITLPENKHLEETNAGIWIKVFNFAHDDNSPYLTEKIHDKLMEVSESSLAQLIDKYAEDNNSVTLVWEYHQLPKFPFKREPLVIHVTLKKGYPYPWVTLKLEPPGLSWSFLIPEHFELLKPNRKSETAVVIESPADNGVRLFLLGWGNYCTEIMLF